ncbi:MAG TPA: Fic family protein [Alphaproteobacteria bacterium]|nr:Fic family protein [Alphaproteobacteria bacterium]
MIPDLRALQFSLDALTAAGKVDWLKGAWPALSRMTEAQLEALENQAINEAAAASSRIEGLAPDTATSERYRTTLAAALAAPRTTEASLAELHRALLGNGADAGAYKSKSNTVEAFGADGKSLGAIFEAEKPENIARRMAELIAWIESALIDPDTHPLAAISVFVALFLDIHPFRTGTTRLALILATALMARAGYDHARYGALARSIEAGKYSYYLALRRTVASLRTPQPDWRHWLDFFFRALRQQAQDLEDQVAADRAVGDDLPDLSARILAIARAEGRVTIATAAQATGISRNTIKDHVGRLTEQGLLALHGAGRGAWYGLR